MSALGSAPGSTPGRGSALGQGSAQGARAQAPAVRRAGDVGDCERTEVMRAIPDHPRRLDEPRDLFQPFEPPTDGPIAAPISGPSDASKPPWGEDDPLPLAEQQSAWLRRGSSEAFATPAAESRSKQILGITVLAVVVLGLVGAAVAYFLAAGPSRISSDQIAAPVPAPRDLPAPPAPLAPPVDTAHALSDPPGQVRGGGGLFDLPQLESTGLLPRPIVKALQAGEMTDGVLKTTTALDTTIGMFALTMPDQQAATTVAQMIATAQLDGGLKADDNRALQGVEVMGSPLGSDPTVYRAVYVLYNRAIFLEVFGPRREAVQATFDSLLKQQVSYAPPTVRVGH
ncbi:MAG: hypothetical protein ACRDR6_20040 [Pseudonocardiaceae bacterium]